MAMAIPAARPALRLRPAVTALAVLVIAGLTGLALYHLLAEANWSDIVAALGSLPPTRLAAAIGFTALSHLLLTLYDRLALASLGQRIAWRTSARAAFTSYTLSHNLGFAPLTGGAARLRIYGRAGIAPATVARIVVIAGCAFWGGIAAVAGLVLLAMPQGIALFGLVIAPSLARLAGAGVVTVLGLLMVLPRWAPRLAARIGAVLPLPRPGMLMALLGVAALDLALASAALLVLIPGLGLQDFPQLFLAYAIAVIAGLVTHVPGGVGVFEGAVIAALPDEGAAILAALIAYRAIYYLLPLGISLALNAVIEGRALDAGRRVRRIAAVVAMETGPWAMAAMTFAGGLVLLFSGALPGLHPRLAALGDWLPLPFIEMAHLAGSLSGAALLLVAPALLSRSRPGFAAARALLVAGAAFSLGKGLDFEEAGTLLAMAAVLHACSPAFYRPALGALSSYNRGWLLAAIVAVLASVASGLAAYRHVPLGSDAWWRFALRADVSRYLRASFATGLLVAAFAVRELLSRPATAAGSPDLPDEIFAKATAACGRSDAMLALTGDKRFVIAGQGDAFLMFCPADRTWFVMGDPVGPVARWAELVWDLRRQADLAGARICFYQVSDAFLPLAVEIGLKPVKYGEEAILPLGTFSLAGPRLKSLRNSHARGLREGLALTLVAPGEVGQWLPRLRPLSDAWLSRHGRHEKCFSLGAFDPAYLARCGLAVVTDRAGKPIAFANLWRSGDGREFSVDLMRQGPGAPPGTMDFLLVELLREARTGGAERFNLGVAPLSGMSGGRLAPAWARAAGIVFAAPGIRYNFRGLRRYKEKFAPEWQNRYIAIPEGMAGISAVIRLARLIGN